MSYSRRNFIQSTLKYSGCIALSGPLVSCTFFNEKNSVNSKKKSFNKPVSVYCNWSSYDELSDNVFLNEEIAMKQLDEMLRLRKVGVKFDYYLMDAFWFDQNGGYREWRKESWPNGEQKWISSCLENDVVPGLWISTNVMGFGGNYRFLNPMKAWEDSVAVNNSSFSLFEGGYLPDLLAALKYHASRGVRMFKFDFADFNAATSISVAKMNQKEIVAANKTAFANALKDLKKSYPDILLLAYNGFGGQLSNTFEPFENTIEHEWLTIFDSLYCGDPKPSDVPCMNFWRSTDVYSDHMVKQYDFNRIPLAQIDSSGFMIGKTGTCYKRGSQAWKGTLLLSLARGGWMNTYHGNLDLLSDNDGEWFAKAQSLYYPMQEQNNINLLGGIPGNSEWYGYHALSEAGELILLVNPSQDFKTIELNFKSRRDLGRILFSDAGFLPKLSEDSLKLGPEQMVLLGFGKFSDSKFELGIGNDVVIPENIQNIEANWEINDIQMEMTFIPKSGNDIRIVLMQEDEFGNPFRSTGGSPPNGKLLTEIIQIKAFQENVELPLSFNYDKAIWSGLSWGVAELKKDKISFEKPLILRCSSTETKVKLKCQLYYVRYGENA